jgi:hypothetical protein
LIRYFPTCEAGSSNYRTKTEADSTSCDVAISATKATAQVRRRFEKANYFRIKQPETRQVRPFQAYDMSTVLPKSIVVHAPSMLGDEDLEKTMMKSGFFFHEYIG